MVATFEHNWEIIDEDIDFGGYWHKSGNDYRTNTTKDRRGKLKISSCWKDWPINREVVLKNKDKLKPLCWKDFDVAKLLYKKLVGYYIRQRSLCLPFSQVLNNANKYAKETMRELLK